MGIAAALLCAEHLERRYGDRTVVSVDALQVASGEVLAVLGPNGAGKSTLFRLLMLLERPDAGRIVFDGRTVGAGDGPAMRRMAGVFQRPYLFDGTVARNVAFGLRARGVERTERIERVREALKWLGLEDLAGAPVTALSGGEAQRVALARAFVLRPDLLLLDEPTANLDVTVRRQFREDLERLARTHARAALLITHDPTDAFSLADRIAVMQEGRIVQTGTPEALVLEPATPFIAAFTGAELLLDGVVREIGEGLATLDLGDGETIVASVAAERASGMRQGDRAHIAYRPEDVVLSGAAEAGRTSAVNHYRLRVRSIQPAGGLVRARLDGGVDLTAVLTRRSASALGVTPGATIHAQLKASALRAFPTA